MPNGLDYSWIERFVLIGALSLCVVVGCLSPGDATWQRLQETGTLRIGMDASFPPFESIAADGSLAGLDVDLAREVSRRLALEPQFVANLPYDGLYDALTAGRVDVVISALPVDPSRMENYAYSRSYFIAGQVLVTRAGQQGIQSMSDLGGHRLAVVLGTEGDREGRQWERRLPGLVLIQYRTPSEALGAVQRGKSDVALVDRVSAMQEAGEKDDLTIVGEPVIEVPYACVVRRDSTRLLEAVNGVLVAMEEDGTMEALVSKWLR